MRKRLIGIALLAVWVAASSCIHSDAEDDVTLLLDQTAQIDTYLASSAPGAYVVHDINGIRMVISEFGNGYPAQLSTPVDVDYVGTLFSNNQQFDAGSIKKSPVSSFIDGWKVALTTLPAGSKATLYIPSLFAYGKNGQGSVPGNAILVFNIDFKKIYRSQSELDRFAADTLAIDHYIDSVGITAVKDTTGMRYLFTQNAAGGRPTLYDKVSFHIAYRLLTDPAKIIGEYDLEPSSNGYNRVVDQPSNGIKLALTKMPLSSTATFYIPSIHAYGPIGATQGSNQIIPSNANIIVDITLKGIQPPE
ncbi:MAG: FKBP-type peptidyl-prolyl cis-trans isomerase [Chryseolinea sp.]